jgi:hypothetical protein
MIGAGKSDAAKKRAKMNIFVVIYAIKNIKNPAGMAGFYVMKENIGSGIC